MDAFDFGYFYDTTTVGVTVINQPKHTIYALSASTPVQYDLTGWTKNATIFKKITTPTLIMNFYMENQRMNFSVTYWGKSGRLW